MNLYLEWAGNHNSFYPPLLVPRSVANECSAQGSVDQACLFGALDCLYWPSDSLLRSELREYGAWDDLDTADTDTLRQRTLFVISNQLLENERPT